MSIFLVAVQGQVIRLALIILCVCSIAQPSLAVNKEKNKAVEEKIVDANWGSKKGEIGEVPGSRTGHTAGNSINPIAVDSFGNVYVGDSLNYRVQKYSAKGAFIHEIKFEKPSGMSVIDDIYIGNDNRVFVAHPNRQEIGSYTADGKRISIIDLKGVGVSERTKDDKIIFNDKTSFLVRKIRTDRNNNIYILGGQLEGDLLKVGTKGEIIKRWGPGIHNFFINEQDVLYIQKAGAVVEKYRDGYLEGTAAQYDKKGNFISTGWGFDSNIMWPEYIDSSGNVYGFSPFGRNLLTVCDLKYKKMYDMPVEQLIEERWTVDAKGNVYITRSKGRFQVIRISLVPNKK